FYISRDATHHYNQNNLVLVQPNALQNLQTFTLECWVTMPTNSTPEPTWAPPIIKTSYNMTDGYGIIWYPQGSIQTINLYVNNYNAKVGVQLPVLRTAPTANTGQHRFHHVVGTYDPAVGMKIYVDGILGASGPSVGAVIPGPGALRFGQGWGSYVGKIDE